MKKGAVKKNIAMLLAVCMVMNSVHGSAFASIQENGKEASGEGGASQEEAAVIALDPLKIQEAAQLAAETGLLTEPPAAVATASEAVAFDQASFQLGDASLLLAEGEELPEDTELKVFLSPEAGGYWFDEETEASGYTVTGNEKLIFMIENSGSEAQGYQLRFNDKITDVITVKSKAELLKEYKELTEEEGSQDSKVELPEFDVPAGTNPGGSSGGSGGGASRPETGEEDIKDETGAPDESGGSEETEAPDESEDAGETEAPDESGDAGETEAPDESENAGETEAPDESGDAGETETPDESGDAGETETPDESGDTGKTETPDESEDAGENGTPEESEDAGKTGTPDESDASGFVARAIDRLTGTFTAYAAETVEDETEPSEEAVEPETEEETAAPSEEETEPETETEKETQPQETLPAESVATDSNAGSKVEIEEDQSGENREFISADDGSYIRLEAETAALLIRSELETLDLEEGGLFAAASDEAEDEFVPRASNTKAVGIVALDYSQIMPNVLERVVTDEDAGFYVNLYNYAPGYTDQSGNYTNIDNNGPEADDVMNMYIRRELKNIHLRFSSEYSFDKAADADAATKAYNYWYKSNVYNNISQKMVDDNGMDNEVVSFSGLFPDSSADADGDGKITFNNKDLGNGIEYDAIHLYPNVNIGDFLAYDDTTGYYTYDSDSDGIRLTGNQLERVKEDEGNEGFWPFGARNYFFGMEIGFDFYKPESGRFNKEPMEFSFSGDDDVWVYIEDASGEEKKLALDLGGIHGRVDGTINFETGVITYSGEHLRANGDEHPEANSPLINNADAGKIEGSGNNQKAYAYLYTREVAQQKGLDDAYNYLNYVGLDPESGICHLTFYYLERGAGESNCSLKFNLPTIPTENIRVLKEVTTNSSTDLTDMEYGFELVSSAEVEELKRYIQDGSAGPDTSVSVEYIGINADGGVTLDTLPKDTFFFIREINPGNAEVKWEIMSLYDTVQEIEPSTDQTRTPIYQVISDEENGFLIKCENVYEGLAPGYHKRAWKDYETGDSTYDIVLDVTGDTMKSSLGRPGEKIKEPVVTDAISSNVIFSDPVAGADAPQLYLTNGSVEGTSPDGISAVAKGTRLSAVVEGTKVIYSLNGSQVAAYDTASRRLTWYVADELGAKETKSLVYQVQAVGEYEENPSDYPNLGDVDTGTHEKEKGYYSNVSAFLTYEQLEGQTLPYLQPVVRPDEVQMASFTVEKQVVGDDTARDKEFEFTAEIEDEDGSPYSGQILIDGESETITDGKYEFTLSHGEDITITLPEGCTYTITEADFDDGEYAVTGTVIEKNGREISEIEDEKAQGNDTEYLFINTVAPYEPLQITKKVIGAGADTYTFKIEPMSSGTNPKILLDGKELTEGTFSITASQKEEGVEGSVTLMVHPKDAGKEFKVTETDTKGAWKTTVNDSDGTTVSDIKAGGEQSVAFINYYYSHSLTLKKQVEGYNPDPTAAYSFTLELQSDSTLTDTEKAGILVDGKAAVFDSAAGNRISLSLSNGGQAVLSGLPKKVTGVVITESLTQPDGDYRLELDRILIGEQEQTPGTPGQIILSLPAEADFGQTVTYVNKYTQRQGQLTIAKQIVDAEGKPTGIDKTRAFRFKVEQLDPQTNEVLMTFYKTLVLTPEQEEAGTSVTVTVPEGKYRVTELAAAKYQCLDNEQEAVVSADAPGSLTFKNKRQSDRYFTDYGYAVNQVVSDGQEGYEYKPADSSAQDSAPLARLFRKDD